jgi:hypothetical protein
MAVGGAQTALNHWPWWVEPVTSAREHRSSYRRPRGVAAPDAGGRDRPRPVRLARPRLARPRDQPPAAARRRPLPHVRPARAPRRRPAEQGEGARAARPVGDVGDGEHVARATDRARLPPARAPARATGDGSPLGLRQALAAIAAPASERQGEPPAATTDLSARMREARAASEQAHPDAAALADLDAARERLDRQVRRARRRGCEPGERARRGGTVRRRRGGWAR